MIDFKDSSIIFTNQDGTQNYTVNLDTLLRRPEAYFHKVFKGVFLEIMKLDVTSEDFRNFFFTVYRGIVGQYDVKNLLKLKITKKTADELIEAKNAALNCKWFSDNYCESSEDVLAVVSGDVVPEFLNACKTAKEIIKSNMKKYKGAEHYFNKAYIVASESSFKFYATDGYRFFYKTFEADTKKQGVFYLDFDTVCNFAKIKQPKNKKWMSESVTIPELPLFDNIPDFDRALLKKDEINFTFKALVAEIKKTIEDFISVYKKDNPRNVINCVCNKYGIFLTCCGASVKISEEKMTDNYIFHFNGAFILDYLKSTTSEYIEIATNKDFRKAFCIDGVCLVMSINKNVNDNPDQYADLGASKVPEVPDAVDAPEVPEVPEASEAVNAPEVPAAVNVPDAVDVSDTFNSVDRVNHSITIVKTVKPVKAFKLLRTSKAPEVLKCSGIITLKTKPGDLKNFTKKPYCSRRKKTGINSTLQKTLLFYHCKEKRKTGGFFEVLQFGIFGGLSPPDNPDIEIFSI